MPQRRFLGVFTVLTALLSILIPGCGGDDGSPTQPIVPDPVDTTEISGTVALDSLGVEALDLISVWDDPLEVSGAGDYSITMSAEAPQLLAAVDATGQLRALSL